MNMDGCPVSQEYINGSNFQTEQIPHNNINILSNGTGNHMFPLNNESIIMVNKTIEIEYNEQESVTSIKCCEPHKTAAPTFTFDNQSAVNITNNLQSSTIFPIDDVLSDEQKQLLSNVESNLLHSKGNHDLQTCRMSESGYFPVTKIINYDSVPLKLTVDDAPIEELPTLPETEQNSLCMEFEQEQQQQSNLSEFTVVVGACEYPLSLTSEAKEHNHDSLAFIGPVLPNYHGQESLEKTFFSDQDVPLSISTSSCRENQSFTDDLRYNLSVESVPRLTATASSELLRDCDNFLRGCKWSPDGNCVLTNSNDNCLRIFYPFDELSHNKQMVAGVKMKECSQIYDFAWHPQMNNLETNYCKIACTCSGIPIHLWDAATGQIVANYRAYDQFDEITAAYSLSFSSDGRQIYAGYNKAIRIFDVDYPVRTCKTVKTYDSQRKEGQTGIISCFTFSPDGNGMYVAGSYSRHIGIYDSTCDKLVCLMQGQHGGVTHLMFSPDATKLYSGGRKDAEILCWDIRNMDKILFSALRDVKTNQRMYFDLSQTGRYLVSGNNDGTVAFWDTLNPVEEINGDSFLKPCSQFQAHGDCVNGVSFNHHYNMLATASGQRHFHNFNNDSSDSSDDENMVETKTWDFSLRLWQIPLLV